MRKRLNVFIGLLNLLIGLWLGHWTLTFWQGLREGRNGVTQAMLLLISALSLDRFRVALSYVTTRLHSSSQTLFEELLRISGLIFIIGALMNLYYQIEQDHE